MLVLRSPCLSPFTPNSMLEMLFRIFRRRASMSTGVLTAAPSTLNLGARGLSKSDATFCPSPVYPIVICRNAIKACTLKFYVRHNCSTPNKQLLFCTWGAGWSQWWVVRKTCPKKRNSKNGTNYFHTAGWFLWLRCWRLSISVHFPFVFRYVFRSFSVMFSIGKTQHFVT